MSCCLLAWFQASVFARLCHVMAFSSTLCCLSHRASFSCHRHFSTLELRPPPGHHFQVPSSSNTGKSKASKARPGTSKPCIDRAQAWEEGLKTGPGPDEVFLNPGLCSGGHSSNKQVHSGLKKLTSWRCVARRGWGQFVLGWFASWFEIIGGMEMI